MCRWTIETLTFAYLKTLPFCVISHIRRFNFQSEGKIVSKSVTHQAYSVKKCGRIETLKLKDSDILGVDGSFIAQTSNEVEFSPKKVDRYTLTKPRCSEIWTVSQQDIFYITAKMNIARVWDASVMNDFSRHSCLFVCFFSKLY